MDEELDIRYTDNYIPISPLLKTRRFKRWMTPRPTSNYESVQLMPNWDYIRDYAKQTYEKAISERLSNRAAAHRK